MLGVYRTRAANDAALLQPLANACWRASVFEWAVYKNAEAVRHLWSEGARALVEGFARRRSGFDPSPDQLILAFHLTIAARERDAFTSLASIAPNSGKTASRESRAFRTSRAHSHLAEGYALVARSLVERDGELARRAARSLVAAREASERDWWEEHFPNATEATWQAREHDGVCILLSIIARQIAVALTPENDLLAARDGEAQTMHAAREFADTTDEILMRLEQFVATEADHHPKLYVWLPGIALCAMAASAGVPMEWLQERYDARSFVYSRLPVELIQITN